MFVIEGLFVERGGKEMSLALVGKAYLIDLSAQSCVVTIKTSRLDAMLIQPVAQLRHPIREAYIGRFRDSDARHSAAGGTIL
jgi:hypothetical protein